jgi:hypothetical protein
MIVRYTARIVIQSARTKAVRGYLIAAGGLGEGEEINP